MNSAIWARALFILTINSGFIPQENTPVVLTSRKYCVYCEVGNGIVFILLGIIPAGSARVTGFLLPALRSSPVSAILSVLHIHLHLTKRTSGRRLETFKQSLALWNIGDKWTLNHFHFPCSCYKHSNSIYSALIASLNWFGRGIQQNGHYYSFALQSRVSGTRTQHYIRNCMNCTQMSLMSQAHILRLMWGSILMANHNPRSDWIK
jgi:hypothetical protein